MNENVYLVGSGVNNVGLALPGVRHAGSNNVVTITGYIGNLNLGDNPITNSLTRAKTPASPKKSS